jgi:hypothetical protein
VNALGLRQTEVSNAKFNSLDQQLAPEDIYLFPSLVPVRRIR